MNENGIKIIQFESTFKKHGDLKIRLHYDELKSRDFFNAIVEGYVNRDERIISFVDDVKKDKQISLVKRKKANKAYAGAKRIKKQFALDPQEIENIFDIIEQEEEL